MRSALSRPARRPIRTHDLTPARAIWRARRGAFLAFALGFLAFLPYPAIPVGNNSAIQLGDLIAILLAAPLLLVSWKRKPYFIYLVILVPMCISLVKGALTQQPGVDASLKAVLMFALTGTSLLAAQRYFPRWSLQIFTGIAVATLLHVLVGIWQMYVFSAGGDLPLQALYVNPSFLSVKDQAVNFVRYEQRPFGLFPEPSAMASSLAPWALLWIGELCGLVKFLTPPARWQRALFTTAAVGALLLIIASRSGHTIVTLAALLFLGVFWLKNARARARDYVAILSVFGVLLPVALWLAFLAVGDRVRESTGNNASWQDRTNSLIVGFQLWTHSGFLSFLFGLGTGMSADAMAKRYNFDAIWSCLLTYLYETGIPGLLALSWIGSQLARIWKRMSFNVVFAAIVFVWVVGITITTSYVQLLPIWMTLGLLTVWPSVCQSGTKPTRRRAPPPRVAFAQPSVSGWTDPLEEENLGMTPWSTDPAPPTDPSPSAGASPPAGSPSPKGS